MILCCLNVCILGGRSSSALVLNLNSVPNFHTQGSSECTRRRCPTCSNLTKSLPRAGGLSNLDLKKQKVLQYLFIWDEKERTVSHFASLPPSHGSKQNGWCWINFCNVVPGVPGISQQQIKVRSKLWLLNSFMLLWFSVLLQKIRETNVVISLGRKRKAKGTKQNRHKQTLPHISQDFWRLTWKKYWKQNHKHLLPISVKNPVNHISADKHTVSSFTLP